MALQTDQRSLRSLLFFASAPLIGLTVIVAIVAVGGHMERLFQEDLAATMFALAPFVIVGAVASGASRRGNLVGSCAWLGGVASVLAMFLIGYLDYQQAIRQHAWTAAALSGGAAVCMALPASAVGSYIGYWIGMAITKRQSRPSEGRNGNLNNGGAKPGATDV